MNGLEIPKNVRLKMAFNWSLGFIVLLLSYGMIAWHLSRDVIDIAIVGIALAINAAGWVSMSRAGSTMNDFLLKYICETVSHIHSGLSHEFGWVLVPANDSTSKKPLKQDGEKDSNKKD